MNRTNYLVCLGLGSVRDFRLCRLVGIFGVTGTPDASRRTAAAGQALRRS
jgi:hypothetical protein